MWSGGLTGVVACAKGPPIASRSAHDRIEQLHQRGSPVGRAPSDAGIGGIVADDSALRTLAS